MATAIKSAARTIRHDNYTASTPALRAVGIDTVYVTISNRATDPLDLIQVSFDEGANYFTIPPQATFTFEAWGLLSYTIRATAAPVPVECLYGVEG